MALTWQTSCVREGGPTARLLSMLLRRAVPGDEMAVAAVHVRSWQSAYRGLLPDSYLDGLRPANRASQYSFEDAGHRQAMTFVAVVDDVIAGFVAFGPSSDLDRGRSGEIYAIYVDPVSWGTGLGRALIDDAGDRLRDQGFEDALLWVLVGNERAERFYRINGWRPDGSRRLERVHGVTVDEARYIRG